MLRPVQYAKQMNCLLNSQLEAFYPTGKLFYTRHISNILPASWSWQHTPQHFYQTGLTCNQKTKPKESPIRQSLVEAKDKPFAELTLGQKVKQVGTDATYTGIVIAGIAVTGLMFYAIGRELFSGQSPSGIYSRAFKACKKCEKIIDTFGHPLKAYGEMTTRGRRRFVRHTMFEVNGVKHIRLMFHLEGPDKKGTVHVEAKQDNRGKYQFEYILVELDSIPHRTIIVEDNR